ncbi:dihydrodipicolinate synthase [Streptococcus gallolyticus]|uniref:4-hydroxy-tetrahydrodipicolinate synthase n=1 Tax=Streptococcus gallolyticus TaxID=315405 RepID=A0AA94SAS4_9STRE|nr:4-hydroxy-tetrahydrodipicolinate synthase [Streptococcus gallolyticus]AQP43238.1 dihydrodipicolinate synthase [Streptococcus gallolyticus subsp. gallolyticus DSM 16831]SQG80537.1 dihydrodipicolinate synthase [Streptococcus gallolyticus]
MRITGIITAMVTPLNDDGSLSRDGVVSLVNRLIKNGVSGLFILGTNGEFFGLSDDEKVAYAKMVVEVVAGRVPIYVGTGAIGTKKVITLSQRMEEVGVSAISIITPYLLSFSQDELYAHYKLISDTVSLPIILYNIPQNTGNNLEPETVGRLAKHPNIIGIKDSSGNLEQLAKYIDLTRQEDFSVLIGSDSRILAALQLGADGAVAATSNVLTKTDVGIYEHFLNHQLKEAEKLQESINAYRKVLKYSTIPSVLKYTLNQIGIPVGDSLSPVKLTLTVDEKKEINKVLKSYQEYENFEGKIK